jgi:sugar/nucleoside kinase (ribokinase family)
MGTEKKIIGIGNALMDVVIKLPNDELLGKYCFAKGSMTLVDAAASQQIDQDTKAFERIFAPGGSVANSIDGLAHLGTEVGFIGKVGADALGQSYRDGLLKIGANPVLFESKTATGIAMALITPDSERTFGTYLGAAVELSPEDISIDLFRGYDIAYIEGYLVQNHNLVRKATEMARKAGLTIALDLASFNVVESNLDFLKQILTEYVDIIFANEDEAKAFTGLEPAEAIHELSKYCDIAVVKIGKKGSLIKTHSELIRVGVIESKAIDTTGAGDLYAAGFLYGFSKNMSMAKCGEIASIIAGKVITVYGARLDNISWKEIRYHIAEMM